MSSLEYDLGEVISEEVTVESRALPVGNFDGYTILDIGCGLGDDLLDPRFAGAAELIGVDVNYRQLEIARRAHHLSGNRAPIVFIPAMAENLPLPTQSCDLVMSKLALPYTDIPRSLSQARRVLKDGGDLFLAMHDWRMQAHWFAEAARRGAWKRVIDHSYVLGASAWFHLTGDCIARPFDWSFETFQTRSRMDKELRRAGFRNIRHSVRVFEQRRAWVIEAHT